MRINKINTSIGAFDEAINNSILFHTLTHTIDAHCCCSNNNGIANIRQDFEMEATGGWRWYYGNFLWQIFLIFFDKNSIHLNTANMSSNCHSQIILTEHLFSKQRLHPYPYYDCHPYEHWTCNNNELLLHVISNCILIHLFFLTIWFDCDVYNEKGPPTHYPDATITCSHILQ